MTTNPLVEALRAFIGAAYPVAGEINPRGHNWSEAYLDEALALAKAALASSGNEASRDDKGLVERLRAVRNDPRGRLHDDTVVWFPLTVADCERAADRLTALSSGNEVAKVVGWLREQDDFATADAIARGDHLASDAAPLTGG